MMDNIKDNKFYVLPKNSSLHICKDDLPIETIALITNENFTGTISIGLENDIFVMYYDNLTEDQKLSNLYDVLKSEYVKDKKIKGIKSFPNIFDKIKESKQNEDLININKELFDNFNQFYDSIDQAINYIKLLIENESQQGTLHHNDYIFLSFYNDTENYFNWHAQLKNCNGKKFDNKFKIVNYTRMYYKKLLKFVFDYFFEYDISYTTFNIDGSDRIYFRIFF